MDDLLARATKHLRDILAHALRMEPGEKTLVLFDTEAPLARLFTQAYRNVLPNGQFVDMGTVTAADVAVLFDALKPKDAVILVQSSNFRLNEFRIRIELFQRGLKTIEHTHLSRMPEAEWDAYLDAFAYDPAYYRPRGHALKERLDRAQGATVECTLPDGTKTLLTYETGMEPAKLNIGDYTGLKNVGGTFPIGEVFTEPQDLARVNGDVMIFAFAGEDHFVRTYEPFRATITDGVLTASPEAPEAFHAILEKVRQDEPTTVREFGLGLNPAMGKARLVTDITAFERQKGLHFSIGAKHTIYPKPGFHRKHGRYHVDVFIDVSRITLDGEAIYTDGDFVV